jgi:glycosyltransferase involved in cell wall biosynthesis
MAAPTLAEYDAYAELRDRAQPLEAESAPVVSVVTVTLNGAATLERAVRSVQQQSFPSIEQIFVDGGSSDGTVRIIRRLARAHDFWISEPDRGISDAFNKGVALARGRYVQILNADDWLSPDQIERGVAALRATGADFVFGDLIFYEDGRPTFKYTGDPYYARVIHRRMPAISHPTVLAARNCFARIGMFDLAYRNAMDYDWLARLHRAGAWGAYSREIVGHMTHAGVSNRQFKRTIMDVKAIAIAHGRSPVLASAEALGRYVKTAASQPLKRHARPLYRLIRQAINPSFDPAPAARPDADGTADA